MSARWTSWLAVSVWTVAVIFGLFMLTMAYAGGGLDDLVAYSFLFITGLSLATVGALLGIHRPENPIGWIFLASGLSHSLTYSSDRYSRYITEISPGMLPELTPLHWMGAWVWVTAIFLPATFGILIFPTGRPPSSRWRRFGLIAALMMVMVIVAEMLSPGPLDSLGQYPEITNPIAIHSLSALFDVVLTIGNVAGIVLVIVAAGSIFARLRSATAIERQQIKWFGYAALIPAFGFIVYVVLLAWPGVPGETASIIGEIIAALGLALIPVAIGIAILRHNLYDIDRLINRTLVYGLLTVTLAATYFSIVLGLGWLLRAVTGGSSPVVVAASTLAVAALFHPLRNRFQYSVDRHFFRHKYDAGRAMEAISSQMRDELDPATLGTEICSIVQTTVQPAYMSLWLRPDRRDAIR